MKLTLTAWYTKWCGDGRRPSGAIYKTTKYKHWSTTSDGRTLCGRTMKGNPIKSDLPVCPICEKRFRKLSERHGAK